MPRVSRCKEAHNGGRGEGWGGGGTMPLKVKDLGFAPPPTPPIPSLSPGRQQRCADQCVQGLFVLGRVMIRDSLQWHSVYPQHGGLAAPAAAGFPADVNHGSHVQLVLQVQTTHRTLLTQPRHQLAFTSGALF